MAAAYSCQITIHNLLKQLLTLSNNSNQSLDAGSWQLAPPETILDNEEGTFYSVGDSSNGKRSLGTSGSVLYEVVLPECKGVQWLIRLTLAISRERRTFDA